MPTGYHWDGKKSRCVDRFVRYPYPSMAISSYKKEFPTKPSYAKHHREAFNLEKETKIINPHKVEANTTSKEFFKGQKGPRAQPKEKPYFENTAPIRTTSTNMMNYPNWKNGVTKDIFHEKQPQFPVYSLPFGGQSTYKVTFVPDKIE